MLKNNTGLSNRSKEYNAKKAIFKILSDRQWHQTIEFKTSTKLSSATIAKHLKEMTHSGMIERKEDAESGKYPIPVFYKASQELSEYISSIQMREVFRDNIDGMIEETKDPLIILEMIHIYSQTWFLNILTEMQRRKDMKAYEITWLEDIFLFESYEQMMRSLIEASDKIIDEINLDQMLFAQAARSREFSELLIQQHAQDLIARNPEVLKESGCDKDSILKELCKEISKRTSVKDYSKAKSN